MRFQVAALLAAASFAAAKPRPTKSTPTTTGWETRYTATGAKEVAEAAATAKTSSPRSCVKGKAFDRLVIVYFENQNYAKAEGDRTFCFLYP